MLSFELDIKDNDSDVYWICPRGCKKLLGDLQGDQSKDLLY
jgi:hypothetical protein